MRWILGAIILLLVGFVMQWGLLVYAMYALLGVITVSRFLAKHWIESIDAVRECNRLVAEVGDKVAVSVTITNKSSIPVPWLLLEDSLPNEALAQRPPRLKVEGRRIALMQLGGHGQNVLLYQLTFAMRGYYQLGPLLIEGGDPFWTASTIQGRDGSSLCACLSENRSADWL